VTGTPGAAIRLAYGRHVLESATGGDEVAAFGRWFADPVVMRPLGRAARLTPEPEILSWIGQHDRRLSHLFVIRRTDTRIPVGYATMRLDAHNRVAWIDISIGVWNEGDSQIALQDAGIACVAWALEDLGLAKIAVQIAETNERTRLWLDRRLSLEGVLRGEIATPDGGRGTLLRYGLLREDWPTLRRHLEDRSARGIPPTVQRPFRPREATMPQ
jgi:RimJ/RimL family protein N-acetyltransferase